MTSGDIGSSSADQATEQGKIDRTEEADESESGASTADAGPSLAGDHPSSIDPGTSSGDAGPDAADKAPISTDQAQGSSDKGVKNDSGGDRAESHKEDAKKEVGGVEMGQGQGAGYTQAIGAEYFNITDAESWPVAGLLVLLDGVHQPVRAELQFYEDLPVEIEEAAVRQARSILQKKYAGTEPLPMRFILAIQAPEVMDVPLPPPGARPRAAGSKSWTPLVLGVVGVIAIIALIGLGLSFVGSPGGEAVVDEQPAGSAAQIVASEGEASSGEAASEESGGAAAATSMEVLPASKNARSDVGIGVRVRILPGLILTLRSQAGPTAGEEIGYMEDGEEASVIGGPELTRGETDTIVWWFVRLDDGTEAWAAANTSEKTLLEPVP